jgi:hypothetical protein
MLEAMHDQEGHEEQEWKDELYGIPKHGHGGKHAFNRGVEAPMFTQGEEQAEKSRTSEEQGAPTRSCESAEKG